MTSNKRYHRTLEALLALTLFSSSALAFSGVQVLKKTQFLSKTKSAAGVSTTLSALIYGWDEGDEGDASSPSSYTDLFNDAGSLASCSPVGTAVAEALSYDRDRAGHLARLAVAFSPPERALQLKDIEHVDVVCVRDDSIEVQAIICEDGSCVSVAVPIQFPRECSSSTLEGCVLRNLDELNEEAESTISRQEQQLQNTEDIDLDELCMFNSKVEYPSWWVPPECDANIVVECDTIQRLLNEDEFQADVMSLAQDALRNGQGGESYVVKKARVAVVGPAGICFKVRAEHQMEAGRPIHTLDVMYPFGGEPKKDTGSLRAAVLGAVAAAEGD